jgi:hypothetical protein
MEIRPCLFSLRGTTRRMCVHFGMRYILNTQLALRIKRKRVHRFWKIKNYRA